MHHSKTHDSKLINFQHLVTSRPTTQNPTESVKISLNLPISGNPEIYKIESMFLSYKMQDSTISEREFVDSAIIGQISTFVVLPRSPTTQSLKSTSITQKVSDSFVWITLVFIFCVFIVPGTILMYYKWGVWNFFMTKSLKESCSKAKNLQTTK